MYLADGVDRNKGIAPCPDVRCRYVARDFKGGDKNSEAHTFASMPPIEALKLLIQLSRVDWNGDGQVHRIKVMDAKKAHLNGRVPDGQDHYVELPNEWGAEGQVGRFRRWLYGMRPAAKGWESEYSERLKSIGFEKRKVGDNPVLVRKA